MLIPFGLKENKIYHVNNVPNGLACGCVCPKCYQPLIAKNQGNVRDPYFSHTKDTECADYQVMTYLHRYAQQLIESERKIVLPAFSIIPEVELKDGSTITGKTIRFAEIETQFDSVKSEYAWGRFRIDSYATRHDRSLLIEITVTHENDPEKIMAIKDADQSAIEIVLSGLHDSDVLYDDAAIRAAVFSPKNARWIHHSKAMHMLERAYKQLEDEANRRNHDIDASREAKKTAQLQSEKKERIRRENIENAKQRFRDKLSEDLSWLADVTSTWINEHEQYKQKLNPPFLKEIDLDISTNLIGKEINGYWIFECCREHWQSLVLNQLYKIGMNKAINANDIKKFVIYHAGLNQHMNRLNIAQFEARQKAKQNGSNTNRRIAWYLSPEENKKIISPFSVVFEYLKYLARCGLLHRSANSLDFHLNDRTLRDYTTRITLEHQQVKESMQLHLEEIKHAEFKIKEITEHQRTIAIEREQKRIAELVEADRVVFEEYNGEGIRCLNCQFVSPRSVVNKNNICPKCGRADKLSLEQITKEYLVSAVYRYRCNDRPRKSLVNLPQLK